MLPLLLPPRGAQTAQLKNRSRSREEINIIDDEIVVVVVVVVADVALLRVAVVAVVVVSLAVNVLKNAQRD